MELLKSLIAPIFAVHSTSSSEREVETAESGCSSETKKPGLWTSVLLSNSKYQIAKAKNCLPGKQAAFLQFQKKGSAVANVHSLFFHQCGFMMDVMVADFWLPMMLLQQTALISILKRTKIVSLQPLLAWKALYLRNSEAVSQVYFKGQSEWRCSSTQAWDDDVSSAPIMEMYSTHDFLPLQDLQKMTEAAGRMVLARPRHYQRQSWSVSGRI